LLFPFHFEQRAVEGDSYLGSYPHEQVDIAFKQRSLALEIVNREYTKALVLEKYWATNERLCTHLPEQVEAVRRNRLFYGRHIVDEEWLALPVADDKDTLRFRLVQAESGIAYLVEQIR
jgi:hypothetical protein